MAGKTYVTKGYSTYTNIPAPQYGYDHAPTNPGDQSVVEIKKPWAVMPAAGLTKFVASPSKIELLKEYVYAPSMSKTTKYASPTPAHFEGYEHNNYESSSLPDYHGGDAFKKAHNQSSWPVKTSDYSTIDKYGLSSPVHPSEESRLNHSGTNKAWQTAGPPATRHPLTTPTNNINEALGFLEESVHFSPRADPRRRGVLDDLSTRAQPIEPLRRYARPVFVAKSNDARQNFSNTGGTINSHEGVRRYRGTHMP